MWHDPHQLLNFIVIAAAFGLVLSLWLGGVLIWSMVRRQRDQAVRQRLQVVQSGHPDAPGRVLRLWHEGNEVTTVVPGWRAGAVRWRG